MHPTDFGIIGTQPLQKPHEEEEDEFGGVGAGVGVNVSVNGVTALAIGSGGGAVGSGTAIASPTAKWGNLGGWTSNTPTSPSIWNMQGVKSPPGLTQQSPAHRRPSLNLDLHSAAFLAGNGQMSSQGGPSMEFTRQQRSLSFSVPFSQGHTEPFSSQQQPFSLNSVIEDDHPTAMAQPNPLSLGVPPPHSPHQLLQEFAFDAKNRTRSKSLNAAFLNNSSSPAGNSNTMPSPKSDHIISAPPQQLSIDYERMWNDTSMYGQQPRSAGGPLRMDTSMHRRASTTPSNYNNWPAQPAQVDAEYTETPSPDALERYRQQRRFSHAPTSLYQDLLIPPAEHTAPPGYDGRRRHSMAGPYIPTTQTGFESLSLEPATPSATAAPPAFKNIDDYFENTEHRTRAWVEAGKNLQMQTMGTTAGTAAAASSSDSTWPLYVVEFKAGRRDFFYASAADAASLQIGDLVIVEADRGKDLGKIIHFPLNNPEELESYRERFPDVLVEMREVIPKKIHRKATNPEVQLLVPKSADEAKAVAVCVSKIRQRGLQMEVVDAEYQWDRRKLTFYFVSEKRIDFRELVRELFKLYKTRIWMYFSF